MQSNSLFSSAESASSARFTSGDLDVVALADQFDDAGSLRGSSSTSSRRRTARSRNVRDVREGGVEASLVTGFSR